MAEMVTYLPISSPFIRFAGRYADEAFGFAAGWNFFIFEAILVPFEMTACNVVIHFWSDAVPTGAVIAIVMVSTIFDRWLVRSPDSQLFVDRCYTLSSI